VLGLTFKEDIPDTRNSKAQDVLLQFGKLGFHVEAHDPFLTPEEIKQRNMTPGSLQSGPYDAVIFLVPHKEYVMAGVDVMLKALKPGGILYDLKSILDPEAVRKAGRTYLAL
jgi:UDP-N-acetyl-D-galactosamine dehydrogenase